MGLVYEIEEASGVVRVTTTGAPTAREQQEFWRKLSAELVGRRPLRLIDDRRGIELFASSQDVREGAALAAELVGPFEGARIAVVVPAKVAYGMARMFQAYADALPIHFAAFYDIEEANQWVLEQ